MGIVNNAINPMAEDPQDTAFRQARLAEQAARDQVSIGQGGKAIAPVQDFTQPIPFYQNPSYLDTMWKMAHDGGTAMFPGGSGMNPQVQQGEAAQRGEFFRQQKNMESNGFLPPGVTQQGLIAQARSRAPQQQGTMGRPYISAEHQPVGGGKADQQDRGDDCHKARRA